MTLAQRLQTPLKPSRSNRSTMLLGARSLLLPVVILALRLASPETADISYIALTGYALFGRPQVIQALFLLWLMTMFNPGLAPESSIANVGRYAIIFVAALSVVLRGNLMRFGPLKSTPQANGFAVGTVLLGVFFIYHSFLFSSVVDISVLKAVSFTLAMATSLAAWTSLPGASREQVEIFVFGSLIAILFASLPLIFSPLGYLVNGTGFQGILNHPQPFGLTAALVGAWLGARFFVDRYLPWWLWVTLVLCPVLILLSEARTAGLSLVLGLAFSLVVSNIYNRRTFRHGWAKARIELLLLLSFAALIFAGPILEDRLQYFLSKSGRGDASNLIQEAEASRGKLLYPMLANINEHPLTGIGFGIASDPFQMQIKRDPIYGLPIGASIEKGIMPAAILEELGIPGFLLVAAWIWMLMRNAARAGLVPLAVLSTALFVNLGENIFFSPGGMGLLVMILVAWAATAWSGTRYRATRRV